MEIDSKELQFVVSNKSNLIDWRVRPLVLDIQKMLKIVPNWKLMVIRRNANAATYWIAVHTRKGMCMADWIRHRLFSLVGILNKDGLYVPP